MPQPPSEPFDNDATRFEATKVYIESAEFTATTIANAFLKSATRSSYIPCFNSSEVDRACLEKFTIQLATLAYRQPVSINEVKDIIDLALQISSTENSFNSGIQIVIQTILQDPRFLFRFETGIANNGNFNLNSFEYLSRLTFFILGSPPTLSQIQEVELGVFNSDSSKSDFIDKLFSDPAFVSQMDLFHSFWLGYSALIDQNANAIDFRIESKALINKVLQDKLPWSTILTSKETYANMNLSKLYDLDNQTSLEWAWRKYKGGERQGLLSHGSFLTVGSKFGDTSISRRGYNIQKAIFCGKIGKPPPVDENGIPISIDAPPVSDIQYNCKEELFRNTVLTRKSCSTCHSLMDYAAFGLENYNGDGSFRSTENGKPNCVIKGRGEAYVMTNSGLTKVGDFSGPKGLADLALQSGYAEKCMAKRLLEFSLGKNLNFSDEELINKVYFLNKKSTDFKSFLKTYLLSAEFSSRKGP